jgi:hypothetical protein
MMTGKDMHSMKLALVAVLIFIEQLYLSFRRWGSRPACFVLRWNKSSYGTAVTSFVLLLTTEPMFKIS